MNYRQITVSYRKQVSKSLISFRSVMGLKNAGFIFKFLNEIKRLINFSPINCVVCSSLHYFDRPAEYI